jgi:hypothetical protein
VRRLTILVCAGAVVALSAAPAHADGFITPYYGFNFGGDSANCASLTNCQEKHANFGVSFGTLGPVGFEEDIAYATDFFVSLPGVENNVFTAMSNLLISVPAGPVQPYVLGGLGLVRPHVALDFPKIKSDDNALGYDLGGGINAFLSKHAGFRGDIRHFHTLQDVGVFRLNQIFTGQKLDYWRGSVGLTLRF